MATTRTAQRRPRDVPGYAEALASGRVHPVPAAPPPLLPGPSASRMFGYVLVAIAVWIAAFFGVFALVRNVTAHPGGTRIAIMVPLALVWFAVAVRMLRLVGDRNVQELAHGYTTIRLTFGGFFGSWRRWTSPQEQRMPWDYSGLWVLDGRTGGVLSRPDPRVDPPGYFPSPHRAGALELWTGAAWSGDFR